MNDNITGILGTLVFHLLLVVVFLIIKISSTRSMIDAMIMVEFDEAAIENEFERDAELSPEMEKLLASLMEESRSNIPVNMAERMKEDLSTEKYVDELEQELNESRSEEEIAAEQRLKELMQMEKEDMIMQDEKQNELPEPGIFEGPTRIYYRLEERYHLRLPIPVYKCEGAGIVEVMIVVDQKGRVVQAEVQDQGDDEWEICLSQAARTAALSSRFNADYEAPSRQKGSITYHFVAQ